MKIIPISPFATKDENGNVNFGKACNEVIACLPEDSWISLTDHDTMWTRNSRHALSIMYDYIKAYPDTGLFTSYSNRTKNPNQKWRNGIFENIDSLRFWQEQAELALQMYGSSLEVLDIPNEVSGFHMLFPKSVWNEKPFREDLPNPLAMDNHFTWDVHRQKKPVRLMKALICVHFYRLDTHMNDTNHLINVQ